MFKKFIKFIPFYLLIAVTMLTFLPLPAKAWWNTGHEVVVAVAEQKLTKPTKEKINNLLQVPINTIGDNVLSKQTNNIITAAVWADDIKDNKYNYLEKNYYANLHFIDLPLAQNNKTEMPVKEVKKLISTLINTNKDNVYCGIRQAVKILKNPNESAPNQAIALRFLIHLVGDLHQPMHSSDPLAAGAGTRGGNDILLVNPIKIYNKSPSFSKKHWVYAKNLHALWDSTGGELLQLANPIDVNSNEKADYLNAIIKEAKGVINSYEGAPYSNLKKQNLNTLINDPDIKNWIAGSYLTALKAVNPSLLHYQQRDNIINTYINSEYLNYVKTTSLKQIYLAGNRLANILNAIFDSEKANPKYVQYLKTLS